MAKYSFTTTPSEEAAITAAREAANNARAMPDGKPVEDHPNYAADNAAYIEGVMRSAVKSWVDHFGGANEG
jgi:hypothetical protein